MDIVKAAGMMVIKLYIGAHDIDYWPDNK